MNKKLLAIIMLIATQSAFSQKIGHPETVGFSGNINLNVIQGPRVKITGTITKSKIKKDEYTISAEIAPRTEELKQNIEQNIEEIDIKTDNQ